MTEDNRCPAVSRLGGVQCELDEGHMIIPAGTVNPGEVGTYDHGAPSAHVYWSTLSSRTSAEPDPEPEPSPWSNVTHWVADDSAKGGHHERLTWAQVADRQAAELERLREQNLELQRFRRMFNDLTRNQYGRHEGDLDVNDPTGVSQGNPHLKTGDVIGYGIGAAYRYVVPDREHKHDPQAWVEEGNA